MNWMIPKPVSSDIDEIENSWLRALAFKEDLLSEKIDQTSTQEDRQSVARQTNSSPGSSEYEVYEEYEEYDEAEDQGESTAYPEEEILHDTLSAGQEHTTPTNDPAKTPPVSTVTRITPPGKRTLEARDAEDDYNYSVDELYGAQDLYRFSRAPLMVSSIETDAKRARVE